MTCRQVSVPALVNELGPLQKSQRCIGKTPYHAMSLPCGEAYKRVPGREFEGTVEARSNPFI